MVAGAYTVSTVLDAVRLALGWKGTDQIVTDAEINGFVIENMTSTNSTYQFDLVTAATTGPTGVYKCFHGQSYGLWLWAPTMTCEDDCVYVINTRGYITVTSGTPVAKAITVTGTPVDFATLMVQICHWLAQHRAQEMSVSAGTGSISPSGVMDQLIKMAEYWQGVTALA